MKIETLENSLFWQEYVLKQSKNPVQIARVKQAIIKLQQQIANLGGWYELTEITTKTTSFAKL